MQPALGGVFFLIWLLMMGGMIVGYVVGLVALWRAMKAHEPLAMTARAALDFLRERREV
ncbi:MAG: hypothetical protein QGH74_00815 [Candidatus Brocadiia bacterium]|jgi:hypothetical protein|nr:hypothetical protein [Candidatus Brocadiia bacterium]